MEKIHIRDKNGNPLCGQSQAYLRRTPAQFATLDAVRQCKKCARLMFAAPFSDTAQRIPGTVATSSAEIDRALGRTDQLPNRGPANTNEIKMYLHCRRCLEELPLGTSPEEWARLSVGWTELGLQVWCVRHDANICHIDFEGHKHPANTSRRADA